jgi:hypothetical protein
MAKSSELILPLPDQLMPQLGNIRQRLLTAGTADETEKSD